MSWGANCYFWKCTKCSEVGLFWIGERSVCRKCGHDDGRHNNE